MKRIIKIIPILFLMLILSGCGDAVKKTDDTEEETTAAEEANLETKREDLKQLLDSGATCQVDDDCEVLEGKCPVGCYVGVNRENSDQVREAMDAHVDSCVYRCRPHKGVSCEQNKCTVNF
jgi:PBP1b-binding outer membrane lipoprotein LpoB